MLSLLASSLSLPGVPEEPGSVLRAASPMDACASKQKQATNGMEQLLSAKPTDHVDFGKNGGSCACRYCDGATAAHKPNSVTTDASAPLCLSSDPFPPMFKENSHPAYRCTYPSSLGGGAENGGMAVYPTDTEAKGLADKCLAASPSSRGTSATKRVFLLGDSHALNLVPPLAAAIHGDGYLRTLTATGRGFMAPSSDARLDAFQTSEHPEKDFTGSTAQYRNTAMAALNSSVTKGDVIVVHNYWQDGEDATHAKFYEEAIVKAITEPRGAHFVVMSDFGFPGCDGKGHTCLHQGVARRAEQCFKQFNWEDCAATAKSSTARNSGLKAMADAHASAHFFDMYDLFVDPGTSHISINMPGTQVIWQATDHIDCDDLDKDMPDAGFSSHMSLTGSLYLWPFFCDLLSSFN
jgi:hypothetical protein